MVKNCVVCGNSFNAKTVRAKYCSRKCAHHSRFDRTLEQIRKENFELKKTILELYGSGMKDRQIGEQIGKSSAWVRNQRVELGLPPNKSKAQLERKRLDEWREAFSQEIRICKQCKVGFVPVRTNQLFCCSICERKHNHQVNDIKRKRLEQKQAVENISLNEVYMKYGGICYLCGEACDLNAVKVVNGVPHPLGDYPSREHIVPLSRGGLHTWENIRLAHIRCNSSKGVKSL